MLRFVVLYFVGLNILDLSQTSLVFYSVFTVVSFRAIITLLSVILKRIENFIWNSKTLQISRKITTVITEDLSF